MKTLSLDIFKKMFGDLSPEIQEIINNYKILTDNIAASIIIRNNDGKITYCSPFTEVLTGYSISEICNSQFDFFETIVHENDRDNYNRAKKISSVGEAFQFKYRIQHKSGIEMWVETRTVPIINTLGEITSTLSTTLDVTGAVRYQKQVEEKNRDLQDFNYMVSHDLKAPIFTVKGMTGILKSDFKDKITEDMADIISHISSATDRLEQLVNSILQYARASLEELQLEEVNMFDVINDVLSDFSEQIKDSNCDIKIAQNLPVVLGSRIKMYQILSNLIGNTLKYRSSDRPLSLHIYKQETGNSRYSTIAFKDTASGIPKNKLDSVFRPFQRANTGKIEGAGIGLASVKKLVERLGGDISVESDPDSGSVFYLKLQNYS